MDVLIGKTLGPYQVVDKIGDGGMATVYKAYDPGTARHVALKVLSPLLAGEPGFQGRFDQEARLVAQLEHPNILPIFQYGKQDQYSFIVMPLIASGTLADRLQGRTLEVPRTVEIIHQLASALDYAHSKTIIHRDLKPSNVLINEVGNCYLTDFGIAKLYESAAHFTRTGGIIGTPSYMSPEQGQGGTVDGRSDIYSLGVILYECVTGKVPFEATTPIATVMQHISSPLPSPKLYNPHLSDAVVLVIGKALAKNPDDRFQSAGELALALQTAVTDPDRTIALLGGSAAITVVDVPPGMIPPSGPPPSSVGGQPSAAGAGRSKWAWLAGLVVLMFIAFAGAFIVAGALRDRPAEITTDSGQEPPPVLEITPPIDNTGVGGESTDDGQETGANDNSEVVITASETPTPEPPTPTDTPIPPAPTFTLTPTPEGPFGRIAFVSDRSGKDEIYLLDVRNPQDKRQITNAMGGGRDWWPDWCDENRIVFERADDPWQGDYQEIAMVDVDDGDIRLLTTSSMPSGSTFNGLPSCSHDGRTLAFSTYSSEPAINWAVGTIELDGGSPRFHMLSSDGYALAGNVSWSPDDQAMVFMHYIRDEKNYHIYRVDLDDPYDYTDLSGAFGGNNKYPAWSPDGKWVAFTCGKTYGDDRRWSLCLTPSDYSRVDVVLPDLHIGPERWADLRLVRHALTPNWSPDGKWIAFSSNRDGDFDIYIYSLAEDELINLTNDWPGDEIHPSWGR